MRKVTETVVSAWAKGNTKICGNTQTDGNTIWLHNNAICRKTDNRYKAVMLSLAGWGTPTTRERLNGILDWLNIPCRYYQENFEQMLFILCKKHKQWGLEREYRHRVPIEVNDWFLFVKDDEANRHVYSEWFSTSDDGITTALIDEPYYTKRGGKTQVTTQGVS
tara:strand:- start:1365 stop:1856 length:492 start_codon:yes stop_codon:yes gene_type:complete